jgi:CBS domain-containing membrane protein
MSRAAPSPLHQKTRSRRQRLAKAERLARKSRYAARAGVGGSLALLAILAVSATFVGEESAGLVVASMGASAVLLFAAPEAPLSQPSNVLFGQLLSAVVGVTCAQVFPSPLFAAGLAVGLSIAVMALFSCTHPPGGATALSAVIGGPGVLDLGYQYVLTPVLLNTLIILSVAMIFHLPLRAYPKRFAKPRALPRGAE